MTFFSNIAGKLHRGSGSRQGAKRAAASPEQKQQRRRVAAKAAAAVLVLVVCALPPVFINNAVGYLPLAAYVLAVLISFAYLQVLKRSLVFSEESLVPSCERGTLVDFVLNFENTSPLPFVRLEPYIYISDLFGDADTVTPVAMPLMPFEKRDFSFQARFDHIGTYSAGIQKIVVSDLLGLFTHTIDNPVRHRVEVLPRVADIEDLPLTSTATAESQKPLQTLVTDDLDYAGVREYTWGDPIKTIHWKLSSRLDAGDYLTRLFESFNNPGINIIVDTTAPAYDAESLMFVYDGVVEGALSINQFAREAGLDSFISFYDKYGDEARVRIKNMREFGNLTADLPRISAAAGDEALELLRREGNLIHGQDNVAFCTAHVDEGIVTALVELRLRKRNPLLLVVVPPSMESEVRQRFLRPLRRLDEAQVSYFVLQPAQDDVVQEGR